MTKKAFDEDESQRQISRLKKELAFAQMNQVSKKRIGNQPAAQSVGDGVTAPSIAADS